jgi:hypothetical protein
MTIQERQNIDQNIARANRKIWVTFQRAGFHRYPAASTDPTLSDVSYLGDRHRHLFKFRVAIDVWHQDREIEFHQFLNYCEGLFINQLIDIDFKSVEMLADDLYIKLIQQYPNRTIVIEVSEDGECGCEITYPVSLKEPSSV